jgi:cytidine deaminase
MDIDEKMKKLAEEAIRMRSFSYTPYSGFNVGAALLTKSGKIYTGCNIENAAYTPGICAERTAVFKAVSEGEREFAAIAIAGGPKSAGTEELQYCPPCGVCRQVMMEFFDPASFRIWLVRSVSDIKEYTLGELLPEGFGPANLG